MKRVYAVMMVIALLLVGVLPAAAQGEQDIVTIAVADGRFTTLVSALQQTGLDETLMGEGPFTVFAPTDDAFAKLPAGTLESLDAETLTAILTYHVVPGTVMAADAMSMAGQSAATVQGEEIAISVEGDSVKINDATVIIADIAASNGVIHVIDSVLLPPTIVAAMSSQSMTDNAATTTAAPAVVPQTGADNPMSTLPWLAVITGVVLLGAAFTVRLRTR